MIAKYHEWMKSEDLQLLTASEPLSLEEEYNMQQSWRDDEDKCTFIILDGQQHQQSSENSEIESMIGDVNLFFNDPDDKTVVEVEIMIAEPRARGKGCGKEALCSMIKYGAEELSIQRFTAKIGYANQTSLNLFSKIGFKEVGRSDVFKEVTLELLVNSDVKQVIDSFTSAYRLTSYSND